MGHHFTISFLHSFSWLCRTFNAFTRLHRKEGDRIGYNSRSRILLKYHHDTIEAAGYYWELFTKYCLAVPQGAFIVVGFGCVCSFLVFLAEHFIKHCHDKKYKNGWINSSTTFLTIDCTLETKALNSDAENVLV